MRFNAGLSLSVAAGTRAIAVAHHCGIRVVREAWVGYRSTATGHVQARAGEAVRVDRFRMVLAVDRAWLPMMRASCLYKNKHE